MPQVFAVNLEHHYGPQERAALKADIEAQVVHLDVCVVLLPPGVQITVQPMYAGAAIAHATVTGPVETNDIVQLADTPGPEGTEVQHVDDPDYVEPPIRFVWLFADQCDDEQKLQAVGTDAGDAKRARRDGRSRRTS